MISLCGPAIIYLIFSVTQIIIDVFKGLYNTAFMKAIVMVMVTLLLNILCEKGLSVVSWIIVFIPFIMMTVVVSMLLYIFGLNASTGSINYKCNNSNTNCNKNVTMDTLGNIIIYDPEYDVNKKPIYENILEVFYGFKDNKKKTLTLYIQAIIKGLEWDTEFIFNRTDTIILTRDVLPYFERVEDYEKCSEIKNLYEVLTNKKELSII